MTNLPPNPLPDDLDELVTAYLDGEATPNEVARVEADVNLQARVEVFAAVRDRVGQPIPAGPGALDGALAAALAAFDHRNEDSVGGTGGDSGVVVPHRRLGRFAPVLAAVAGLVVVAGLVSVLTRSNASDDSATASAELADAAATAGETTVDADASSAVKSDLGDGGGGAVPALGEFALADEVALAASTPAADESTYANGTAAGAATTTAASAAPTDANPQASPTTVVVRASSGTAANCAGTPIASATVDGEPVVVVEVTDPSGTRLQVYRQSDCQLLADRPR